MSEVLEGLVNASKMLEFCSFVVSTYDIMDMSQLLYFIYTVCASKDRLLWILNLSV